MYGIYYILGKQKALEWESRMKQKWESKRLCQRKNTFYVHVCKFKHLGVCVLVCVCVCVCVSVRVSERE
jgi:hypothetical protein